VDALGIPGRIMPAYNLVYPVARSIQNTIQVRFTAGYATAAEIPKSYRQLILAFVSHWYENREPVQMGSMLEVPSFLQSLINQHTIYEL